MMGIMQMRGDGALEKLPLAFERNAEKTVQLMR